jgi:hypothetical protein
MAVVVRKAASKQYREPRVRKASQTGPEPTYAALHRVADRNVAPLARAFLAAFDRLRDMHSEDEWEQAVGRGTWSSLVADLERISFVKAINPAELDPLADMLVNVAVDAGSAMISYQGLDAAGIATITNSFTVVNPAAVYWAQNYAAQLVGGIVVESQDAIRGIISRAMAEGGAPRDTAQLIRHTIGLNQRQVSAIGNYRAGLVADGVDPARIERLVARKATRSLNDRALTIARTETMSAANHGQQLLWGEMRSRGLLDPSMRKVFIAALDDRLCPRCAAMDGQTVEVIGGRFAEESGATAQMPPIHPRCRCTTGLVDVEARKPTELRDDLSLDETADYLRQRHGITLDLAGLTPADREAFIGVARAVDDVVAKFPQIMARSDWRFQGIKTVEAEHIPRVIRENADQFWGATKNSGEGPWVYIQTGEAFRDGGGMLGEIGFGYPQTTYDTMFHEMGHVVAAMDDRLEKWAVSARYETWDTKRKLHNDVTSIYAFQDKAEWYAETFSFLNNPVIREYRPISKAGQARYEAYRKTLNETAQAYYNDPTMKVM